MSSSTVSLCRICLGEGAMIPIFEDFKSENGSVINIRDQLSICLNEKFEDLQGYPRHICRHCQETLNTVYDFINKYKETCQILQNSWQVIVKQENVAYADSDDFEYPEYNEIETLDLKPKTQIKIEFENGAHFIEKVKPLCNLKTDGKRKSKKVNSLVEKKTIEKPQRNTLSKNKTNIIKASILEGDFSWDGEDWCYTNSQKTDRKKVQVENVTDNPQHLSKPEKKDLNSVLCETCGQNFKSQHYLRHHIDIKHKNKSVTCSICNVKISSHHYLSRHIKTVHGTKDFICCKCGKGFAYKKGLDNHVKKVHEKISLQKRQVCKFCDRDFVNKNGLIAHERSAHTGERPAICTVCNAGFFHEDYLKEHMRLHTGERPFKCPVCGRGYAQRGNMKSHMRNHRISELSQEILDKIKPSWYRFMKP